MSDLSTTYMGLKLANPLVVASSSLTNTVAGVERCADAGAGGVVLKSLFEEQIDIDAKDLLEEETWLYGHPEAFDYARKMSKELGPREYLEFLERTKSAVSIPVIASLNCISPKWWVDYAMQIETAGADGLELNVSVMPSDPDRGGEEIEKLYYRILEEVRARIRIPIAVKIGPYFSSMANVAAELGRRGASALVIFNRFYQMDIDIDSLELSAGHRFSSPHEINLSLRWIALLAGRIGCDLAASTGVHDGSGVVKQLLAGANAVQVCSTLYLHGLEQIGRMLEGLREWMKKHGFASLEEVQGKLSQMQSDHPELYERLQYIKALTGTE